MRYILLVLLSLCLIYPTIAQDEIKHKLQARDTWESLEATYDTCREAIIYHNNISLGGIYSKYYVMTVGTTFTIPPQSACDELPTGATTHTVLLGETPLDIYTKYRHHPNQMPFLVLGEQPHPLFLENFLNVGDQISIPDIVPFYQNNADLIVIEDASYFDPIVHELQVSDTLDGLANQYQTCREAIIWENKLTLARAESIAYVFAGGDTILIPPATACDDLPYGEYKLTLAERATQQSIIRRYQQNEWMYYERNVPVEGLLKANTPQILPYVENMYLSGYDLYVARDVDDTQPTIHIAQHGDTFDSLMQKYQTCISAILNVNDLHRTSITDPTFIIKLGTELEIPPASECDTIPHDPIVVEIQEGDTLWGVSFWYNTSIQTIIDTSIDSPDSQLGTDDEPEFMKSMNHIEPGLKLVIPDSAQQYKPKAGERLLVVDDNNLVIKPSPRLSLTEIAMCYGIDVWELYEVNGLRDARYSGGSLIIPNPQHDCILRDTGYPNGILACYPEPLQEIATLDTDISLEPVLIDEEDSANCYRIQEVYDYLFAEQSVLFLDIADNGGSWGLTYNMLNYCYHQANQEFKDITWDIYDATILPPDDNITVFAQLDDIPCNREMFNDFYMYQVQRFDGLSSIAKAYGTHPNLIAQANNLENPNIIYVGQYLKIPTPTIFNVVQWLGGIVALIIAGMGLRQLLRQRRYKIKRKPKEVQSIK